MFREQASFLVSPISSQGFIGQYILKLPSTCCLRKSLQLCCIWFFSSIQLITQTKLTVQVQKSSTSCLFGIARKQEFNSQALASQTPSSKGRLSMKTIIFSQLDAFTSRFSATKFQLGLHNAWFLSYQFFFNSQALSPILTCVTLPQCSHNFFSICKNTISVLQASKIINGNVGLSSWVRVVLLTNTLLCHIQSPLLVYYHLEKEREYIESPLAPQKRIRRTLQCMIA